MTTDPPLSVKVFGQYASKRRREVIFTADLRSLVAETTNKVRQLIQTGTVPSPVADSRCPDCSLIDACMPYAINDFRRSASTNKLFQILE